jgi:ribosomal-protein-alanine N-acetyltransferase
MTCIVQAGQAHTHVLSALHHACFEPAWNESAFGDLLNIPGMIALIADCDAEPAGFVLVQTHTDEAEIITIGVLPAFRHQGIGGKLLLAAQKEVPDLENLFIEVDELNIDAIAFYQRAGFARTGLRKNYYSHKDAAPSDAIMMVLASPAKA